MRGSGGGCYTTLMTRRYLGMTKAKDPLKRYAKKFYKRVSSVHVFIERRRVVCDPGMITCTWMFCPLTATFGRGCSPP